MDDFLGVELVFRIVRPIQMMRALLIVFLMATTSSAGSHGLRDGLRSLTRPSPSAKLGRMVPERRLAVLLHRRARQPRRFDRSHPFLGRMLRRSERLRLASGCDRRTLNGLLPHTPLVRYLIWRRSLAPRRFDRYHPALGAILAEDARMRELPPCVAPMPDPPRLPALEVPPGVPGGEPPFVPPTPPTNPAVPEPAAWALLLAGSPFLMRWRPRQ